MRILLLGDYSGLLMNLKDGLKELGHEVCLLSNGDGWKKIPGSDGVLNRYNSGIMGKVSKIIQPVFDKRLIGGYDAVILINLFMFSPLTANIVLKRIKKYNGKLVLCACGIDYPIYKMWKEKKFDYYMFDGLELRYDSKILWKLYGRFFEKEHIKKYVDVVVPMMYEYKIGYEEVSCNISDCVPAPINLSKIEYKENIVKNNKIVIFHGLNNEISKGTKYIKEALDIIKERYKDKVEVIIDGKMPYNEYIKVLEKTNVLIDQCKSYGYGINACVAMAQGKIVLSGARNETLEYYNMDREECPIIPIQPNKNTIVEQIEKIIENQNNIPFVGKESRKYVEKYHDSVEIAKKYVSIINEC